MNPLENFNSILPLNRIREIQECGPIALEWIAQINAITALASTILSFASLLFGAVGALSFIPLTLQLIINNDIAHVLEEAQQALSDPRSLLPDQPLDTFIPSRIHSLFERTLLLRHIEGFILPPLSHWIMRYVA